MSKPKFYILEVIGSAKHPMESKWIGPFKTEAEREVEAKRLRASRTNDKDATASRYYRMNVEDAIENVKEAKKAA